MAFLFLEKFMMIIDIKYLLMTYLRFTFRVFMALSFIVLSASSTRSFRSWIKTGNLYLTGSAIRKAVTWFLKSLDFYVEGE